MDDNALVWYVAYGSNLESSGIDHHLAVERGARADAHRVAEVDTVSPESHWIDIPHSLYFAGRSKTWAGPVAFVSLSPAVLPDQARGRAFLLRVSELERIVQSENGCADLPDITYALGIPVGAWAPLPVSLGEDGYKGKYNALLRLPNAPDSRPVLTLTTSRELEMAAPSESYLSRVRAGLALDPIAADLPDRLGFALVHSGPNSEFVNEKPAVPIRWRGTIVAGGKPREVASITLPSRFNGSSSEVRMAQATVFLKRHRVNLWVFFEDVAQAKFSPAAIRLLGQEVVRTAEHTPVSIDIEETRALRRARGGTHDLPDSDVVHVGSVEASRLGGWALLMNEGVVGPVRVFARTDIPPAGVRAAYATRTLFSQDPGHQVLLQPIRSGSVDWRNLIARPFYKIGEELLGAPATALRATEGLVGDEGRPVIRVDGGALDFIGAEPGDTVTVTWAYRSVKARVLLQTELTRQRMDDQLSEKTGQQLRQSLLKSGVDSRLSVPPHLRAWMSPALRTSLGVPADTVVRVRRSLGYLILKNSSRLALPMTALFIAGIAIPDVNVTGWLTVSIAILALTLVPSRLRHVSGKEHKTRSRRW